MPSLYGDVLIAFSTEAGRFKAQNLGVTEGRKRHCEHFAPPWPSKMAYKVTSSSPTHQTAPASAPLKQPFTQNRSSWYGRPFYSSRSATVTHFDRFHAVRIHCATSVDFRTDTRNETICTGRTRDCPRKASDSNTVMIQN